MVKAVNAIQQINSALIEHNDPLPNNILIVPGDPETVICVDSGVEITYSDSIYIGNRNTAGLRLKLPSYKFYPLLPLLLTGFTGS